MRGPYGYSYPTGYYDHIYEADDNPNPSEPRPVYLPPPPPDHLSERSGNATIARRSEYRHYYEPPVSPKPPPVDPDTDPDLEQRSFGFKVTVYKTPQGRRESDSSSSEFLCV